MHKEQAVMIVHTLGPKGTNCEKPACYGYKIRVRGKSGFMKRWKKRCSMLNRQKFSPLRLRRLPVLHQIVFENLADLKIIDSL
ncbi:hypothetical protein PO124_02695 [Bacillus licheniformis]|nr:hypothetical protein [Bacillus licheniformis]